MEFYLIGIKGAGMSSLANILIDLGHNVSGVDYEKKHFTQANFRNLIHVEKFEEIILSDKYFYIIGNAFKLHDISLKIIEKYKYSYYPEFINNFFKMKKVGISGSHGKTTTTSLIGQMTNKNVTTLTGDGCGFGKIDSKYFVFEACEYQNTFLNYDMDYLLILNIDYDHPDFFKNPSEYQFAFMKAALNSNVVILNNDDKGCRKIVAKNIITFGYSIDSDVVMRLVGDKLILLIDNEKFELPFYFYGKHQSYNLAASFICCYLMGFKDIKVDNLKLPVRRMEEYKLKDDLILINDYAHHPTEIEATINSIREKYPSFKLVVVYQGHTYSRSKEFYFEYINALKKSDEIYIMPIFSSVREDDFEPYLLLSENDGFKKYSQDKIMEYIFEKNLVIAFLGAGDIDNEFIFLYKKK